MYKFSRNSLKTIATVHPKLQQVLRLAITRSRIDFGVPSTGGLRTFEQQNKLFRDGVSKCDGFSKKSDHQDNHGIGYSLAVDVYDYVDGRAMYDNQNLTYIATVMLGCAAELGVKLKWGGHWSTFKDLPHFYIDYEDL